MPSTAVSATSVGEEFASAEPAAAEHPSAKPPVASGVVIATPPDWHVVDLDGYVDAAATQSLIAQQLEGRAQGGAAFAAKVAELAGGAARKGIFFAAVSIPGDGGSVDLTSVTLAALPQIAVSSPTERPARSESSYLLEVTPQVVLPLFCVEYALTIPGSERVVVMTFTTIAPSDTERLCEQFAEIASTLTFT